MALPETSEDFDPRIHDDTRWEQERDPLRLLLEKEPVQVPGTDLKTNARACFFFVQCERACPVRRIASKFSENVLTIRAVL